MVSNREMAILRSGFIKNGLDVARAAREVRDLMHEMEAKVMSLAIVADRDATLLILKYGMMKLEGLDPDALSDFQPEMAKTILERIDPDLDDEPLSKILDELFDELLAAGAEYVKDYLRRDRP